MSTESVLSYRPNRGDRVFVDTNVWLSLTYPASVRTWARDKVRAYADFIRGCSTRGAMLYYSQLVAHELCSVIERVQHVIYNELHGEVGKKDYRRISAERAIVMSELDSSLTQVAQLAELLPVSLNAASYEQMRETLSSSLLDGYDVLHLQTMMQAGISTILTDDRDFGTVRDIIVIHDEN